MYKEEDYLQLSGLQHFIFCRRQWALIHVENQWAEDYRTADGQIFHTKAHDETAREKRGDTLILRGLKIASPTLGLSGECDVVEFHRGADGVPLSGEEGLWHPFPVEYKRGEPKEYDADRLQLCAQAMCLEEMLCCTIPAGALYYGQTRRRENVAFTEDLRAGVRTALAEMHELMKRGHTPKVKAKKSCNACSLKELCLPSLDRRGSGAAFLRKSLEELG